MLRQGLAALSLLAVFGWAGQAQAQSSVFDDVDAPTLTLGLDGDDGDDIELVRWRGGYYGGYRGFYGGGYGYRGFYGGYRHVGHYHGGYRHYGHYGHYHRPFYAHYGHYHRPFYASYGYYHRPFYSSYYYRPFYYSSYSYPYYNGGYYNGGYYSYPAYYSWCSDDVVGVTPSYPLGQLPSVPQAPSDNGTPQMPKADDYQNNGAPPADGTYRYDGGPSNQIPLPDVTPRPAPTKNPQRTAPLKGHLVSIPDRTQVAKDTFRAYGETQPRNEVTFRTAAEAAPTPAASSTTRQATGFAFPAYGESQQKSSFATNR